VKAIKIKRDRLDGAIKGTVSKQDRYLIEIADFQQKLEETQEQIRKQREMFLEQIEALNEQQKMLERLVERQNRSQKSLEDVNKQLKEKISVLEAEESRIKTLQGQSHYNVQPVAGQQPAVEATPLPPEVPVDYSVSIPDRREAVKKVSIGVSVDQNGFVNTSLIFASF